MKAPSRGAMAAACWILAAIAAMPAFASFRFPLVHRLIKRERRIDNAGGSPAVLPESQLGFRAADPKTGAVFSRYDSPLSPDAALDEAARALVRSGWRLVMKTASLALFENGASRCAAVMATPAESGAGSSVAVLVQR